MIAIIGGGITGLAAAHTLHSQGIDFQLFEASGVVGGAIRSVRDGEYLLEYGPNSLRLDDATYHFLREIGIHTRIQRTQLAAKHRFVLKHGKYSPLPQGPVSFLLGSFFPFSVKKRIWQERNIPAQAIEHESVDAFFRRRFGDFVTEYAVYPFVSGIYAGDPKALLVEEVFPDLPKYEREYGSVIRGFMKAPRNKQQHKGIVSFPDGLGEIPQAIEKIIEKHIRLNHPVQQIVPTADGYEITFPTGTVNASAIIATLPAHALAQLFPSATALAAIPYPPVAAVYTTYKRQSVGHLLNGFGALHPAKEGAFGLGTIFSSSNFYGRCPEDEVLLTTFVGGSLSPEKTQLSDQEICEAVAHDHELFLGAQKPVFQAINRWQRAIPQYTAAMLDIPAVLDAMAAQRIFLGGNWTGGVSVGACIAQGKKLAAAATRSLTN